MRLEWCAGDGPRNRGEHFPLADELQSRLAAGGCAAVVCNTVDRAPAVYCRLQEQFTLREQAGETDVPQLSLFHARFPFTDRERIEKETLWRYDQMGDDAA